jgi:methanethiol oxidase
LYVSAWGTGELFQYDVSDPFHPMQTASVRLGGIVGKAPHPSAPEVPLTGGPQMVEVSRDGRTENGGLGIDERFFPHGSEFQGLRVHQTHLEGGDASSDSYCYQ